VVRYCRQTAAALPFMIVARSIVLFALAAPFETGGA
jgi:hypothetical protein